MAKSDQITARIDPASRAWTKLAASLCATSESEFVRIAVFEKLNRIFETPAPPEPPPPPLAADPEISAKTSSDRRSERDLRFSAAATRATRAKLRQLAPVKGELS